MGAGRPSKYQDTHPAELVEHMKKGYSFDSFGAVIHASKDTMYDWVAKYESDGVTPNPRYHEAFSDAKKEGELLAMLFWERVGLHAALGVPLEFKDADGNTHSAQNYNATIWIFTMKNKFGWRDKIDATSGDKPLQEQTSHQALKEIAEVLRDAHRNDSPANPTGSGEGLADGTNPSESPN